MKRPTTRAATGWARSTASKALSDEAALQEYLREPPKLARLTRKTKPPEGYARYGPKDVHETIEDFLRAEPQGPARSKEEISLKPKAMHNQVELDEAVTLIGQDNKAGIKQGRRLGENRETGTSSSQAPLIPVVEHHWHANARSPGAQESAMGTKAKSRPMRIPRTTSGSGMQYRPREDIPPAPDQAPGPRQGPALSTGEGTKKRSQPIRKFKPRQGITFPVPGPSTEPGNGVQEARTLPPTHQTQRLRDGPIRMPG